MNELFRKYAYHIDELRKDSNISINTFCENICEPRTYRYYISGSRVMSQKILNGFCKKLGFTPKDFYASYNISDKEEYQQVISLYLNISNSRFELAKKQLLLLDQKQFTNPLAESLYEFSVIEYNFLNKNITKEHAYDLFCSLIDYPKCLSKKTFTITDVASMKSISTIEIQINDYSAFNKLKLLLIDPDTNLVSSEQRDILPYLYAYISYISGLQSKIELSKDYAKKGIELSHKLQSMDVLDKLYYYYSLSSFKLNLPDWKEYIPKYLAMLIVKYDKEYILNKIAMLEKDGMVNASQYVRE